MIDTEDTRGAARRAADAFADAAGLERGGVEILNPEWAQYLRMGARVVGSVGRWRAKSAMTLEDFGIAPKTEEQRKAWQRTVKLGEGYLLPIEYISRAAKIENEYRDSIHDNAFETPWGPFMPAERLAEWLPQAETIKAKYLALRDEIIEKWDDLQKQVSASYAVIGYQNYEALRAAGKPPADDLEDWIRAFVKRRMSLVPSKEAVRDSFYMKVSIGYLPLQSFMAEDQAAAETLLAETAGLRAEADAKRQAVLEMQRAIAADRQAVAKAEFTDAMRAIRGQLHNKVYEVACDVLEAIQKNGTVPGASVKQIRNLVEYVDRLNFYDDAELNAQIEEIRKLAIDDKPAERAGDVRATMQRIGSAAKLLLLDIQRPPERNGQRAGIPATIAGLELVAGIRQRGQGRTIETAPMPAVDMGRTGQGREVAA